jgi:hypothetical protein
MRRELGVSAPLCCILNIHTSEAMSHTLEAHDHYIYVKMTSPRFEFHDNSRFVASLTEAANRNPNLVINCASIEEISDEALFQVKELYNRNRQQAGIIVISELNESLIPKMEMIGLHCIPSDDEAADYVFMEQIEQDLLRSFDDKGA